MHRIHDTRCASAHIQKPNLASGPEVAKQLYHMCCGFPRTNGRHDCDGDVSPSYVVSDPSRPAEHNTQCLLAISVVQVIFPMTSSHPRCKVEVERLAAALRTDRELCAHKSVGEETYESQHPMGCDPNRKNTEICDCLALVFTKNIWRRCIPHHRERQMEALNMTDALLETQTHRSGLKHPHRRMSDTLSEPNGSPSRLHGKVTHHCIASLLPSLGRLFEPIQQYQSVALQQAPEGVQPLPPPMWSLGGGVVHRVQPMPRRNQKTTACGFGEPPARSKPAPVKAAPWTPSEPTQECKLEGPFRHPSLPILPRTTDFRSEAFRLCTSAQRHACQLHSQKLVSTVAETSILTQVRHATSDPRMVPLAKGSLRYR